MNPFVLVFGIIYPVITLLVWCLGAFGIGATMSNSRERAYETMNAKHDYNVASYAVGRHSAQVFGYVMVTLGAGLFWPVAIPIYLAYRQGTYLDRAMQERDVAREKFTAKYLSPPPGLPDRPRYHVKSSRW